MQKTRVRALGQEEPLEEEMVTHSSILAWEIPCTRSLVGYSPWGCRRVGHILATKQQVRLMYPVYFLELTQHFFPKLLSF